MYIKTYFNRIIKKKTKWTKRRELIMREQEQYKKMLKNVIDATESKKIQTSEELIRTLVNELTTNYSLKSTHQ